MLESQIKKTSAEIISCDYSVHKTAQDLSNSLHNEKGLQLEKK